MSLEEPAALPPPPSPPLPPPYSSLGKRERECVKISFDCVWQNKHIQWQQRQAASVCGEEGHRWHFPVESHCQDSLLQGLSLIVIYLFACFHRCFYGCLLVLKLMVLVLVVKIAALEVTNILETSIDDDGGCGAGSGGCWRWWWWPLCCLA